MRLLKYSCHMYHSRFWVYTCIQYNFSPVHPEDPTEPAARPQCPIHGGGTRRRGSSRRRVLVPCAPTNLDARRLARDEYQKSHPFYPRPFTSFLNTSIIGIEDRKFAGRRLNSGCGRSPEKANFRDLSREDEPQVAPESDLVTPAGNPR